MLDAEYQDKKQRKENKERKGRDKFGKRSRELCVCLCCSFEGTWGVAVVQYVWCFAQCGIPYNGLWVGGWFFLFGREAYSWLLLTLTPANPITQTYTHTHVHRCYTLLKYALYFFLKKREKSSLCPVSTVSFIRLSSEFVARLGNVAKSKIWLRCASSWVQAFKIGLNLNTEFRKHINKTLDRIFQDLINTEWVKVREQKVTVDAYFFCYLVHKSISDLALFVFKKLDFAS